MSNQIQFQANVLKTKHCEEKMKSKSLELKQIAPEKVKHNKTFDFVGFYKTVAETNKQLAENSKAVENNNLEHIKSKKEGKHERTSHKAKRKHKTEAIDISQVTKNGSYVKSNFKGSIPITDPKVTSTPINAKCNTGDSRVKSIMKTKAAEDHPMDGSIFEPSVKSKKRNKSVSFMLEDTEAVIIKKTKSDNSINKNNENTEKEKISKNKNFKKFNRDQKSDKENKVRSNQNVGVNKEELEGKTEELKVEVKKSKIIDKEPEDNKVEPQQSQNNKRKFKKVKSNKADEEPAQPNTTDEQDMKTKKLGKKKLQVRQQNLETKSEGEPLSKFPKKDIAEDLENLSIGDNAHTLTNLLDEMSVVDKDKKKKLRQKFSKGKRKNPEADQKVEQDDEEVKEKVKWNKRKWNKDKKGDLNESMATMVIVENLPISIMLTYKKLLADHFGKYGLIKKIG